jgi:hypothetical protein
VETVFVTPQVATSGLLVYLGDEGLNLLAENELPQGQEEHWVASIGVQDPIDVFQNAWDDLQQGTLGQEYRLQIELRDVNSSLLSPGRQRLVEEMLADLQAGYIGTGFQTGENQTP